MRNIAKQLLLYLSSTVLCVQAAQYQVISLVNNDASMAVVVDGQVYPLTRSDVSSIVHTGTAPLAEHGYFYAKARGSSILEREPFMRPMPELEITPYQFYNRSWDTWEIPSLPQLYDRLSDRIDTDLHLDGQIGTFHIHGNNTWIDEMHNKVYDEIKVLVNVSYIRGNDFFTFPNTEIELSGRSSRWSPKLSYNLKLDKQVGQLYGYRRLKLRALFSDPSYLREAMVLKATRATGVATTDFSFVRVFINDNPAGLYGVVEVLKNPWIQNEFDHGNSDYQQGNLYQAMHTGNLPDVYSDLSYHENHTIYAEGQYKIKEDPSEGLPNFDPLIGLTRFVSDASNYDVAEWDKHFVTESLLRSLALEIVLGFSDGYFAMANNYYLYQNGLNSEQFYFIPSDVDITLGSTIVKLSDMLTGNYSTFPGVHIRPLMNQLLQVPALKDRFELLLQEISQRLVNPTVLFPTLDATVDMIRQDVEWDLSLPRLSTFDWNTVFNDTNPIDIEEALSSYPIDAATIEDSFNRGPISFDVAVNGPTGYISVCGVKEFITNSSRAIQSFYDFCAGFNTKSSYHSTPFLLSNYTPFHSRCSGAVPKHDGNIAVVIDDNIYLLSQSPLDNITYSGSAPVAKQGYFYAEVLADDDIERREAFTRPPTQDDTPYEFFNRSRNYQDIAPVPQLYEPLFNRMHTRLHIDGEIGTVHIVGNQTALDKMHQNALNEDLYAITNMSFIRGNELVNFNDVEVELSGRSSRWNPKLSYTLKLPKDDSLYGYRRLKLRSLFSDPSYIREAVIYRILRAAGLATTDFSYVRLYINDQPAGLFGLIENMKDPWLNNEFAGGDEDYEQGNLYQGRLASDLFGSGGYISDLGYEGDNETIYSAGQYKIKEDPSDDNPSYKPLMELTKFLANAPMDDTSEWEKHFNMESVLRSMALEVALGFSDGYNTLADNYYVYQNGLNEDQFVYIPSDVDISLGSTLVKLSDVLSGNYRTFPGLLDRPLTTQFLRVPEYKQRFEQILQDLAAKLVNPEILDQTIDDLTAMIKEDVDWDKNIPRLGETEIDILANQTSLVFEDGNRFINFIDKETIKEAMERKPIPFEVAVNGPTGYISMTGVKEFINDSSRAILSFYNE
ncbi:coth protein-domain-containing protein [Fennellomyces sp. T-0311]|nr:coth protein-domain-containing protein [Fennellomyces sp. T-0311]